MADERTRIINLPEATSLSDEMNFITDSNNSSGTQRVTLENLKGAITQKEAENLAKAYSNTSTYNVGDLCVYNGELYECTTRIAAAESWTDAHWIRSNIDSKLKGADRSLNGISVKTYRNGEAWNIDVLIEDVPCKIQTDSVSFAVNKDGTQIRGFASAPYIINEAGLYTIRLAVKNTEVSIISGTINTKNSFYGDYFTLRYSGVASVWGSNSQVRQGAAVTIPIVRESFNSLTCDYDCTCFIMDNSVTTDTTPVINSSHALNGYNIVTKDMIEDSECILVVTFSGYSPSNADMKDMPFAVNGVNALNDKFNVDCVIKETLKGGSVSIERNKKKFLDYKMKTVFSKKTDNTIMPQTDDFRGCMYAGGSHSGSFLYHITPAMYRSALCNQFSRAYGLLDSSYFGGVYYGLVCSKTSTLLLGGEYPYTTLDYMLDNVKYGKVEKIDINASLMMAKRGDVLEQRSGHTGHCVFLDGVEVIGKVPIINIYEGTHPYTKHSNFVLSKEMSGYLGHSDPYEYFSEGYDYKLDTDYTKVETIEDKSIWDAGYTDRQAVMCDRGYGALYVTPTSNGETHYSNIFLTIADTVSMIVFSKDGESFGVNTSELTALSGYDTTYDYESGYHVYDVTDIIVAHGYGAYTISADDDIEKLYFKDVSNFDITINKGENETDVVLSSGAPDPLYIVASYRFETGNNSLIYTELTGIPNTVTLPDGSEGTLFDVTAVFFDEETKCTYWKDGTYCGV